MLIRLFQLDMKKKYNKLQMLNNFLILAPKLQLKSTKLKGNILLSKLERGQWQICGL